VYAGSASGKLYAINETTGAVNWTFAGDSAILAGVALMSGPSGEVVAFGTQDGTVYNVLLSGSLLFSQAGLIKGPIVGLGTVGGYMVGTTSNGLIGAVHPSSPIPLLGWGSSYGSSAFGSAPAILDGTLYFGSGNGNVYAFSPHGYNPTPASRRVGGITITVGNASANPWECAIPQ
jgi:outer membrane protein assembly factor BamB